MQKFERFIIYPLLIVALFYAVTGGAGTDILANPFEIEDTIRTREVEIYNDADKVVGILGSDGPAGVLALYNNRGNEIIGLGATSSEGNGGIFVSNGEGDTLNHITTSINGQVGVIATKDNKGNDLIYLGGATSGNGSFSMYNNQGDDLIYLGTDNDGHGLINVYDKYGDDWTSYGFRR